MLKSLAYAGLISTALIGSAALGQPKGDTNAPPLAPSQPVQDQPATPNGDVFVKQQATNQWRAPKLVGIGVYGPDNTKVGFIEDVLVDHDGNVQLIVIGVGGFLGLGTKEVAVPFKAMQWRTEGRPIPVTNPPPVNPLASTDGANSRPPSRMTDPAATEASQGYPDKALLNVTMAQLKAAPDFRYVPSPLAELDFPSPAAIAGARPQQEP